MDTTTKSTDTLISALITAVLANASDEQILKEAGSRGLAVASAIDEVASDEVLWDAIKDKDSVGAEWVQENPSLALAEIDDCDKEDYARDWVRDNMSEVMGMIDMSDLVDELGSNQKRELFERLAGEAKF